jgi:hypothetical protein
MRSFIGQSHYWRPQGAEPPVTSIGLLVRITQGLRWAVPWGLCHYYSLSSNLVSVTHELLPVTSLGLLSIDSWAKPVTTFGLLSVRLNWLTQDSCYIMFTRLDLNKKHENLVHRWDKQQGTTERNKHNKGPPQGVPHIGLFKCLRRSRVVWGASRVKKKKWER